MRTGYVWDFGPFEYWDLIGLDRGIELIKNKGIKGDRYFKGNGKYSNIPDIRDVTIIEKEVLDALEQNQPPLQEKSIILKPHEHRRNLTSEGVPLNYLVGKKFKIGEVILEGGRLNFPCKYLADLLNKPLFCLLYTSPSPRDKRQSRMPSSA